MHLSVGSTYDFNVLVNRLSSELNYDVEATCETVGEMAVRGGIIDLFPLNASVPIESTFGDEIESIRIFDPNSQRSKNNTDSIQIPSNSIQDQAQDSILSFLSDQSITWIFDNPSLLEKEHPFRIPKIQETTNANTVHFLLEMKQ